MTFDQAVLVGIAIFPFGLAALAVLSLVKKYRAAKRRKNLTLIISEPELKSGRIDVRKATVGSLSDDKPSVTLALKSKSVRKKRKPQRGKRK